MELIPLSLKQDKYLKRYGLVKKFNKQITLLLNNPEYPSLNVEKLIPESLGLYSFRIDRKYRAIFAFSKGLIKIISITNHYKK